MSNRWKITAAYALTAGFVYVSAPVFADQPEGSMSEPEAQEAKSKQEGMQEGMKAEGEMKKEEMSGKEMSGEHAGEHGMHEGSSGEMHEGSH